MEATPYFVSFDFKDNAGNNGVGWATVVRTKPIASEEDISGMIEFIKKETGHASLIILNWKRYEMPETAAEGVV